MTDKINNFSPNMLKTFDECQRKFSYKYLQKLSMPQRSTIFEKGKKIHALANYYLKGENIEKMEKILSPDEKIAWESLKSNKYFNLNVVNTEYNLSCKIGKYWVGGRLDALMINNQIPLCHAELVSADNNINTKNLSPLTFHFSPNYYILDYKTGNIPQNADFDFQTIVYLLCADKFLKTKGGYNSLKFVYLGLKNNTEKEILLNGNLKKDYEQKITSACEKINFAVSSNIMLKNKEKCNNCEYYKICRAL